MQQDKAAAKAVHDVAKEGDGKHYGLVLDPAKDADGVPTRPAVAHTVCVEVNGGLPTLPGFYVPGVPTPVGGAGECPLSLAIDASKQPGCGVMLVEVAEKKLTDLRAAHAEHIEAVAGAVREAAQTNREGGDATRLADEQNAAGVR